MNMARMSHPPDENELEEDQPLTLFPPDLVLDYRIRESPRARTVRLNMTPQDGLIVVIPAGYNHNRIPAILNSKKDWIENARIWAREQRRLLATQAPPAIPKIIDLKAMRETWTVEPRRSQSRRVTARAHTGSLIVLSGPTNDIPACLTALRRWTKRKARDTLVPWLDELSEITELAFDRTIIGNQRSLWASCSPTGTISLNQKLLFLPEKQVRYVLIHELCHTAHMNHSKRFWARVRRHQPDFRELRRELGESWKLVPSWLED